MHIIRDGVYASETASRSIDRGALVSLKDKIKKKREEARVRHERSRNVLK